jgi:hypothetical protein
MEIDEVLVAMITSGPEAVELLEDLELELVVLGGGLDHQLGRLQVVVAGRGLDAGQRASLSASVIFSFLIRRSRLPATVARPF